METSLILSREERPGPIMRRKGDGPQLADLSSLDRAADEVRSALEDAGKVWVVGAEGTGRTTLAHRLLRPSAVSEAAMPHLVWVPSEGADIATHALIQLAAVVEDADTRESITDDEDPLEARVRKVAEAYARAGRGVVLLLPSSWSPERLADDETETDEQESLRLRSVVAALLGEEKLRLVVMSPRLYEPEAFPWSYRAVPPIRLEQIAVNPEAMERREIWGALVEEARRIKEVLLARNGFPSPIAVRLMVALAGLGEAPEEIAMVPHASGVGALTRRIVEALHRRPFRKLQTAAMKVAQARFTIPIGEAERLCMGLDPHSVSIVTCCLGYGTGQYRMVASMREALLNEFLLGKSQLAQTHALHAQAHRAMDGVARPADAGGQRALHWLERLHHLALQGPTGKTRWRDLALNVPGLPRDFLWDRARSLSRDYNAYEEAADIYRICLERHPQDSYSWHYRAFNLERARLLPQEAEAAYRRAVELEPRNPWWNSRYICFLISRARFGQAAREWKEASGRIETERDDDARKIWLALHMHRWVVEKWLDHGRAREAQEVFSIVAEHLREQVPQLRRLAWRLQDALEVEVLGHAVYPTDFPFRDRWRAPAELPATLRGVQRLAWYPARVERAQEGGVELVAASTEPDLEDRTVLQRTLSADEWELAAEEPAIQASGFYFIGEYADGRFVVRPMRAFRGEAAEPMSYWDFWHKKDPILSEAPAPPLAAAR